MVAEKKRPEIPTHDWIARDKKLYYLLGTSDYALEILEFIQIAPASYMEIERYVRRLRKVRGISTPPSPRLVASILQTLGESGLCVKDEEENYRLTHHGYMLSGPSIEDQTRTLGWLTGRIDNFDSIPETERAGFLSHWVATLELNSWKPVEQVDAWLSGTSGIRALTWEGLRDYVFALLFPSGKILLGVVIGVPAKERLEELSVRYYRYATPEAGMQEKSFRDYSFLVTRLTKYRLDLALMSLSVTALADRDGRYGVDLEPFFWMRHGFDDPEGWVKGKTVKDSSGRGIGVVLTLAHPEKAEIQRALEDSIWVRRLVLASILLRAMGRARQTEYHMGELFPKGGIQRDLELELLAKDLGLEHELPLTTKRSLMALLNEDNVDKLSIQSAINTLEEAIADGTLASAGRAKVEELADLAKKRWEKYYRKPWSYQAKEYRGFRKAGAPPPERFEEDGG